MLTVNLSHPAPRGAVKEASVVVQVDPSEIGFSDDFVKFVKENPDTFGSGNVNAILDDIRGQYAVTKEAEPAADAES